MPLHNPDTRRQMKLAIRLKGYGQFSVIFTSRIWFEGEDLCYISLAGYNAGSVQMIPAKNINDIIPIQE